MFYFQHNLQQIHVSNDYSSAITHTHYLYNKPFANTSHNSRVNFAEGGKTRQHREKLL